MRSFATVTFCLFLLALSAARAQSTCATVLLLNRSLYMESLKNFDRLHPRTKAIQNPALEKADFERRILKHLFVETNFFLQDPSNMRWIAPQIDPTWVKKHLLAIEQVFKIQYGVPTGHSLREHHDAMAQFAHKWKFSLEQAHQIVETFEQIAERPDEAAAFLSNLLKRSSFAVAGSQSAMTLAAQANTKARQIVDQREKKLWPTGVPTVGGLVAGFVAPIMMGTPELAMIGWLPGMIAGGWGGGHLLYYVPVISTTQKKYHEFRARRQAAKIRKDVRTLYKEMQPSSSSTKESADAAFNKAWEEWLSSAQEAEGARNKARTERVTDRISQLTLLVEATGQWQLPNGEHFADVLASKDAILTPERQVSLRAGFELKTTQLELMLSELYWVEKDIQQIHAEGEPTALRVNDEALTAARLQLTEGLRQNVLALRAIIEDRQDRLQFIEDTRDAGERSFQTFLVRINQPSPQQRNRR